MRNKITKEKGKGIREKSEGHNVVRSFYFFLIPFLFSLSSYSQCAMCRAALQGEGNVKKAEAVNNGIVYLMVIPYLLVGVIGYTIYRMNRKK